MPAAMPDLDLMLRDLEQFVSIESPSHDLAALARSAAALAGLLEERLGSGARLVDSPAGPHVAWSGGGEPRVLVLGHHDTVFPAGTLEGRPFSISGGHATGPGVFDMKGGIVQAVHGLAALRREGGDLDHVECLFTADEEVGSHASRDLLEERAHACGAVLVLEPSADGGALKVGRKGCGTFEIIVRGRAAHAGLEPEQGLNALVEAARHVLTVAELGNAALGTTVTPTVANAGTADNVVPAEARVRVDVRVEDHDEAERVEAAVRSLEAFDADITIEVVGGIARPPMPEGASAGLFSVAQRVAAERGLGEISGMSVGGGSDGNFTAARGVPTLDGLGAVGAGAHAEHEYIEVAAMPGRARLVGGIVARLSGPGGG